MRVTLSAFISYVRQKLFAMIRKELAGLCEMGGANFSTTGKMCPSSYSFTKSAMAKMDMEMTNKRQVERHAFRMKAQVQPVEMKAFRPVHTWTHDVSSKGLFLEMDQPLQHGTRVLLTLQLPAEVTGKPVLMRCVSRVVRVVNRPNRKFGVGTVIESYDLVRKLEAAPSNGRHGRHNGKTRF